MDPSKVDRNLLVLVAGPKGGGQHCSDSLAETTTVVDGMYCTLQVGACTWPNPDCTISTHTHCTWLHTLGHVGNFCTKLFNVTT